MRKLFLYLEAVLVLVLFGQCSLFKPAQTYPVLASSPTVRQSQPVVNQPQKAPPFNVPAFALVDRRPVYRIALFLPLYLGTVSDTGQSGSGPELPRTVIPGLEFYEGASLALDSLRSQGYRLDVTVYDTKAEHPGLEELLHTPALDSVNLIIGSVDYTELKVISAFAKKHQVNFISATYPNDGGITDNPFLVIVNSTLKTHCAAIVDYVRKSFGGNKNILILLRNNPQEKRIAGYIQEAWKNDPGGPLPSIREVILGDSASETELSHILSQGKNNICIIPILDEGIATHLTAKLASLSASFEINVIGMPNWDGIRDFYGPAYKGLSIFYSTPYYNDKKDPYSGYITDSYLNTYKIRPSDMVFKGFETAYYFSGLIRLDGVYFNRYINDPRYQVITPFDFKPVYNHPDESTPDYFENSYLYFIKIFNGVTYKAS